MHIRNLLLQGALLGSTLAVALAPAMAANLSRADQERALAAQGLHSFVQNSATVRPLFSKGGGYKVLHNFTGAPDDGFGSTAEVTLVKSNIFGTTGYGGTNDAGVLFELSSKGKETILYNFGASGDGATPDGAVIFDKSGNMFGTTQEGGSQSNGTIWELSASGTYTLLHSFASNEGSFIRGRLVEDAQGNLYGTALFGGANGYGSVFEYSSNGTLTILHSFDVTDGEYPEHGVVMDKAGNLYGATAFGGANDDGSVYEISKSGTFTSLYSFTGGNDGDFLYGGLGIDKKGNLYGATAAGGAGASGTVFNITSAGKLTTLYTFTGGADGGDPEGDTSVIGKNIYGAATTGGSGSEGGIYAVTTKGKETMVAPFSTSGGDGYSAGVVAGGKKLYGTTAGGGSAGDGVVFDMKK